jgi:outer membrane protein TolC
LRLDRAVALAVNSDDPALLRLQARADALREQSVAEAQLPDPEITGSLANVPTDSFRFDRDNMSQIRFGVRQQFPAGDSLDIRRQRRLQQSGVELRRQALERLRIALDVRQLWFELFYHEQAIGLIERSQAVVSEQNEALAAGFASGRLHAQDLTRAELEAALLEDQHSDHQIQRQRLRAGLARHIGSVANDPLPEHWPTLAPFSGIDSIEAQLSRHPAVAVEAAQAAVAEHDISLAEQAYKPAWGLEAGYGLRTERPDLASIGVTVSVPIFTGKRQDRRRAAAIRQHSAELLDQDLLLLQLRRDLQQSWADWQGLGERVELYQQLIEARADQTVQAALATYANGQTDFAELMRSQLALLEVQLRRIRVQGEQAQAWARLTYLAGGDS